MKPITYALVFVLGCASWAAWESWRYRGMQIVRVPKGMTIEGIEPSQVRIVPPLPAGYTLDGRPLPPGASLVRSDVFDRLDAERRNKELGLVPTNRFGDALTETHQLTEIKGYNPSTGRIEQGEPMGTADQIDALRRRIEVLERAKK
jgi:hypothetical protein